MISDQVKRPIGTAQPGKDRNGFIRPFVHGMFRFENEEEPRS